MVFIKLLIFATVLLNFNLLQAQNTTFKFLKTGAITPDGWLKKQMQQDVSIGYARYLPQLTDRLHLDVFDVDSSSYMKSGKSGLKGHIWWDGETTGNWLDGYIRIAYLSGNKSAMKEVDQMVNTILSFQESDGYLGTYPKSIRYESPLGVLTNNNGELWSQACLFRGLLGYYELTGKENVLEAVEKAIHLTMSMYNKERPYWSAAIGESGPGHNMMFADVCESLFRITKNREYLEFIIFLYDSWNDLGKITNAPADQLLHNLSDMDLQLKLHGAHVMEHIRVPYSLYGIGGLKYKIAYDNWFRKVENHLTPSGACISDEAIEGRPGSPDIGMEYCTMFELLYSLQSAVEKTGNPKYADMIEKLAFNAPQGARMKNGMAIQYLTKDNQTKRLLNEKNGGRFLLSPAHEQAAVCCIPNSVRFYPYYTSQMWMHTDNENSLVAITYGPSTLNTMVKGTKVEIVEKTYYPFEDRVNFTVNPESSKEFSILFREPNWSKNTKVVASGANIQRQKGFIKITKLWKKGDEVDLEFDSNIILNKSLQDEVYFSRGPLVYSLGFDAEFTKIKSYSVDGFCNMDAKPAKDQSLNYSYIKNNDFKYKNIGGDVNSIWENYEIKLVGKLFNKEKNKVESVDLVPLGTTLFRQTTFKKQ